MRPNRYFRFASRTVVLLCTAAGVLVWLLLVFPSLPIGGPMLDVTAGYSYPELVAAMEGYGARGRRVYAWASPTVDTAFPLMYVTFFSGLLTRLRPADGWLWLAWIPVFAGLWDLCENAQIIALLLMYPAVSETQVAWASFFTHVKTVYLGPAYQLPALALVLVAIVRWCAQRLGRH
ncbi:MAG: hypothetical protein ABIR55_22805 [Burkholderiaceae bacterium]